MCTVSLDDSAQRCLERLDPDHPAMSGADLSNLRDVAERTRRAVVCVPIPKTPGINPRIGRPGDTPEAFLKRCREGTWRSVGREYAMPDGPEYNVSPDPILNSGNREFGEWTWQLNRHAEWRVAAVHYHHHGDAFAADCVATWLKKWLETCPAPTQEFNTERSSWRTIEIGIRLGSTWPPVISAFKDAAEFDDVLWLAWLDSIAEQCGFVWENRKLNNWLLMEMNGLLHAGVQFPFFRDAATWRKNATDTFVAETDIQFHADGFQRELSSGYQTVCVREYLWAYRLLKSAGYEVPPGFTAPISGMRTAWRAMARPDGRVFGFQDSGRVHLEGQIRTLEEELREDADRFFIGEGPPPEKRCDLLPNAGYACLRSGWDKRDTAVAVDVGPFGDAHQHEDKLSIQIWAAGEDLIGEAGLVDYADSPERRYSLGTLAHSTAIVDGHGQNRGQDYVKAQIPMDAKVEAEHDFDCAEPWIRARYDEGYGPDSAIDVVHERTVTLKSVSRIEVRDRLTAQDGRSHRAEILYHVLKDQYAVDGNAFVTKDTGANVRISAVRADGNAIEMTHVCAGDGPDLRGWAKPPFDPNSGRHDLAPRPCVTFSAEFEQSVEIVTTIEIVRTEG